MALQFADQRHIHVDWMHLKDLDVGGVATSDEHLKVVGIDHAMYTSMFLHVDLHLDLTCLNVPECDLFIETGSGHQLEVEHFGHFDDG